jgi:photosystem II stability/assembly factor-like uncharacterized protein
VDVLRVLIPLLVLGCPLGQATIWKAQTSGVAVRLRGVSAVSAQVVWTSGAGNTILRTADGGANWQRLASPSGDELDFRDVDAIDASTAYLLSIGPGALSRIYKTTDAGVHWVLQFTNTDPDAFYDGMAFWDADRGLAVSDSARGAFIIIRTEDGGRTWTRVARDALPAALPNEGAFAGSGTSVAVIGRHLAWIGTGAADRARVLRSTDDGRSWQLAETPVHGGKSAGIFSVAFRDARHGVVVGGDHTKEAEAVENVAVTSDGGVTWRRPRGQGLSGLRTVVSYVPGTPATFIALGPLGGDMSTQDGETWRRIDGDGADTFSFAPGAATGWAAGAAGRLSMLSFVPPE